MYVFSFHRRPPHIAFSQLGFLATAQRVAQYNNMAIGDREKATVVSRCARIINASSRVAFEQCPVGKLHPMMYDLRSGDEQTLLELLGHRCHD
jgi:hypothetical protein